MRSTFRQLGAHAAPTLAGFVVLSALAWGAARSEAATFVVTSSSDSIDADPGDGICADQGAACTLRAAVMEANALAGADAIDLSGISNPLAPIQLSIDGIDETYVASVEPSVPWAVSETPNAAIGDLDITQSVTISVAGSASTIVEWSEASKTDGDPGTGDRIFQVKPTDSDIEVTISGLTVRNGSVATTDIETNPDQTVWQLRRFGGGIGIGIGAAVALFDPNKVPGSSDGGPPENPGGDTGEGSSILGATLDGVWIVANESESDAGGLFNGAETLFVDSAASGNVSGGNGGGIYVAEPIAVVDSTIGKKSSVAALSVGNSAENGGGYFDTGSHASTITGSSILGNTATGGGGIATRTGVTVDILNSTLGGNSAADVGGGATTNGTINLRNVTVSENSSASDAGSGGGGLNSFGSGTFTLGNVVLSANLRGTEPANCGCTGGSCTTGGRFASQGHNLEDADTCGFFLAEDLINTDPLLVALADNGGLTETYDLVLESPAVDAGAQEICDAVVAVIGANTDQRELLRTIDGNDDGSAVCDIGAVEFAPEPGAPAIAAAAIAVLGLVSRRRTL